MSALLPNRTTNRPDQRGFIPLLIMLALAIVAVIVLAFVRLRSA